MEELIKKLVDQAGVTEDVAKKVVEIVSGFMKENLPGGIGEQVTSLLGGGLQGAGGLAEKAGDIAKGLGDILGKSKDARVKRIAEAVMEITASCFHPPPGPWFNA